MACQHQGPGKGWTVEATKGSILPNVVIPYPIQKYHEPLATVNPTDDFAPPGLEIHVGCNVGATPKPGGLLASNLA